MRDHVAFLPRVEKVGSGRGRQSPQGNHRSEPASLRRIVDILFSLAVLTVTLPLLAVIAVGIGITSKGPIFFRQERIGMGKLPFTLHKFRTMVVRMESDSRLTVANDRRVTAIGRLLRRAKLDELPQFINVIRGEMTLVGPRPEVGEIVRHYEPWMEQIFAFKPGLADPATFAYADEPETLAASDDPERTYITEIMPKKLRTSLDYQTRRTAWTDFRLILEIIGWMIRGGAKPVAK